MVSNTGPAGSSEEAETPSSKIQPDILNSCTMCATPGGMNCAICGTKYCSLQCQRRDWKFHKMLCKASVTTYSLSNRPSPSHFRFILFPHARKTPGWGWAALNPEYTHISRPYLSQFLEIPMPPDSSHIEADLHEMAPHLRIGRGLRCYVPAPRSAGDRFSQSFMALAKPGYMKGRYNNVMYMAFSADDKDDKSKTVVRPYDATLRDLRMIIDFELGDMLNPCVCDVERFPYEYWSCKLWQGVKINCKGDLKRFQTFQPMEEVPVLSIGHQGERKEAWYTKALGLSWLWEFCNTNYDIGVDPKSSPDALYNPCGQLFTGPFRDPGPAGEREDAAKGQQRRPAAPPRFHTGSMIVVHRQGAPLRAVHVAVFKMFCTEALEIMYIESERAGRGAGPAGDAQSCPIAEAQRQFTRKNFEGFWKDFCDSRMAGNLAAQGIPSPYAFEDV